MFLHSGSYCRDKLCFFQDPIPRSAHCFQSRTRKCCYHENVGLKYYSCGVYLVPNRVEGSVDGANSNHSMGPTLPGWPAQLKHMETSLVANLGPDAVRALGHGVTVEGQLVIILDEDVQGPVLT